MFTAEEILYLKELYASIFGENADNSKEFIIFANGIPHPLRIKVEEWLVKWHNAEKFYVFNTDTEARALTNKVEAAHELDTFITNYIENTYE